MFAQQVWLGPRGPDAHPSGVADWNALFKQTSEWAAVAAKIQVFSITAGYVIQAPDEDLKAMAADLTSRHIGISLAMQSIGIGPADKCGHEEGYGRPDYTTLAAEKLHRLAIPLQNLALDEPVWFGHYAPGPQGCQFPIPELARRVALNVREYQRYFPDVTIGDIEPVPAITASPDWKATFQSFEHEISAATGQRLTFLQTDVNWRTPSFRTSIQDVAGFAHREGLAFGVIYNGDGADESARAWVADAVHHFELLEEELGLSPDQALIASWDAQPTHVLPETSDETMSHVVREYSLLRTKMTAVHEREAISGRLLDQKGAPVPDAHVVLRLTGLDSTRPPAMHSASGVVPAAARFAIIGLRVNTECLCAGSNDLLVGGMHYAESAGGAVVQTYSLPEEARRRDGRAVDGVKMATTIIGGQPFAHLIVNPDQHFGVNSPVFAVTPGARFDFNVPIGSVPGEGMFGAATIIWLDQARNGLHRTNIFLGQEGAAVASAVTDADGRFKISQKVTPGDRPEIEYGGDMGRRGTLLKLR